MGLSQWTWTMARRLMRILSTLFRLDKILARLSQWTWTMARRLMRILSALFRLDKLRVKFSTLFCLGKLRVISSALFLLDKLRERLPRRTVAFWTLIQISSALFCSAKPRAMRLASALFRSDTPLCRTAMTWSLQMHLE